MHKFHARTTAALFLHCLAIFTTHSVEAFKIYYDSTNYLHRDITYHSEQPERIFSCLDALDVYRRDTQTSYVEFVDIANKVNDSFHFESTHIPCSEEELQFARSILLKTHQKELVTGLEARCRKSKDERIRQGKPSLGHMGYINGPDTYVTTESFDVCLRATVAWIRSVKDGIGIALTRPPGHHATYSLQNGFCLYNFAAAAAMSFSDANISILDWDVHYGQGVADIVSKLENVRYASIHQSPAFPYEGERTEQKKNILTLPMLPDTTWTCGYQNLFEKALEFCANPTWQPDIVVVCAGYDALASDELASCSLNAADYGRMTDRLCRHLSESCGSKTPSLMLGLEGGYQLADAGPSGNLPDAVVATVKALVEQQYLKYS